MFNIYVHVWPKLDNKAKQKENTSAYAYFNILKLNYAPWVYSFLQGILLYFSQKILATMTTYQY